MKAKRRDNRPPHTYTSEHDREHVRVGKPPYPLLSVPDMLTVWRELEMRKMSSRDIAKRLRISRRTVHRWRSKARDRGEME